MAVPQGLCSITPNYLLAAWKNDPRHPVAGDHFPSGVEDQITFASIELPPFGVALPPSDPWTVIGTVPGNTSLAPSLTCDQNLSASGPGPSVYAIWKGEEFDARLFFSRLTLPLDSEGSPTSPASNPWQAQQQYEGATSSASPSITVVAPGGGSGFQTLLFTCWSGLCNGQPGPAGDNTIWYSVTPIPSTPGYVDSLVSPAVTNFIPGASSSNGAAVTASVVEDVQWNVWAMWFDTVLRKWCYSNGEVNGTTILWDAAPTPIAYSSLPNAAGYSVAPFTYLNSGTPSGDITGMYAAWSDESGKIWVTGVWNLLTQNTSPAAPTPMPSATGQATGSSGCALFPLYTQGFQTDQVGILCDYLFAMWADDSGQLHYAATDGFGWQYLGDLANATTGADFGLEFPWPVRIPIRFPIKF